MSDGSFPGFTCRNLPHQRVCHSKLSRSTELAWRPRYGVMLSYSGAKLQLSDTTRGHYISNADANSVSLRRGLSSTFPGSS